MKMPKSDIELSYHRFLEDTKDDFFPDPINYKDLKMRRDKIIDIVSNDLKKTLGARNIAYSNHPYLEGDTPKGHHVVRHTICLHPIDRIVYSFIVTYLAPLIEPNVSKARYSHPLYGKKAKKIFGNRPIQRWLLFKSDICKTVKKEPDYKFIVSTDIAGYFEYIHIHDFKKQLLNLLSTKNTRSKKIIELLGSFLKCFSPCQHSSIPQGNNPSSYLASAFLDFLDKDLEANSLKHFRYVDDVKILCKDKEEAKSAIVKTIHSLRKVNLNLSTIKTEIWDRNGIAFKMFCKTFPPILSKADNAVSNKEKIALDRILPELVRDAKEILKKRKKEFDERLFRAYIWRIVKCYWFKNIQKQNLDYIGKSCLKLLEEMPGRTDSFIRFLVLHKNRKYVQDEVGNIINKSVYPWQKLHLWRLMVLSDKLKNKDLLNIARSFIRDNTKSENARNYALLFLGKHGVYSDRQYISSLFKTANSYFNQRAILIAIQEYAEKNQIYNYVMSSNYEITIKSLVEYLKNIPEPEYVDFDDRIGEEQAFIS